MCVYFSLFFSPILPCFSNESFPFFHTGRDAPCHRLKNGGNKSAKINSHFCCLAAMRPGLPDEKWIRFTLRAAASTIEEA